LKKWLFIETCSDLYFKLFIPTFIHATGARGPPLW
jgi:hypothetical protein